jgi:cation:H+ antiporter
MDVIAFILSFAVILLGCEFFTNGVEWAGKRFNLSEGCIGSVLAAIGTALPETVIPIIAIFLMQDGSSAGEEIGAGAILGAPFMLATLAMFVCGLSVFLFRKRRGTKTLRINGKLIKRDLSFFLAAYSLAAISAFLPSDFAMLKQIVGMILVPLYIVYIWYTVKRGGACPPDEELKDLYCHKIATKIRKVEVDDPYLDPIAEGLERIIRKTEPKTALIFLQIALALSAIIIGANFFVEQIRVAAMEFAINPLILALIIAPVATELPEKFNSFLWIRQGKDTYAIGNITGAMVFQSCIPVTIGVLFTDWHIALDDPVQLLMAVSIGIAMITAAVLLLRSSHKELHTSGLMAGGAMYALFIALVLLIL